SEIESETKIRAKYLRALENEEWNLLPGPTYVKTFLRTYAEALGLDAKLLVEEYKLRHERLSDNELARPIGPPRTTTSGRGRNASHGASQPFVPRSYVVAGVVLALCVVVFILSKVGGNGTGGSGSAATNTGSATTTQTTSTGPAKVTPVAPAKKKASTLVTLRIVPTGDVYACLVAKGRSTPLINGATLTPGTPTAAFKSSRFRLVLGNANAELRVNGKKRPIPQSAQAAAGVFVQITRKGLSALPTAIRPGCTG
ncbi:MAG: hypothetical protein JWO02_2029, partial [Solirubrobacterales bacterium]|nr:hypothetical protein [Solirubrobacterales bacterium]